MWGRDDRGEGETTAVEYSKEKKRNDKRHAHEDEEEQRKTTKVNRRFSTVRGARLAVVRAKIKKEEKRMVMPSRVVRTRTRRNDEAAINVARLSSQVKCDCAVRCGACRLRVRRRKRETAAEPTLSLVLPHFVSFSLCTLSLSRTRTVLS